MAVIIKNMEFPHKCIECPFFSSLMGKAYCGRLYKELPKDICNQPGSYTYKDPDCPLEDIPVMKPVVFTPLGDMMDYYTVEEIKGEKTNE